MCSRVLPLEQYLHHVICTTHNNKVAARLRALLQGPAQPGAKQQGAKQPAAKQPAAQQQAPKRQRVDGPG